MSSSVRTRRLVLLGLLGLGIIGFVLVVTAPADGPPLDSVVTDEGLATRVPEGWQPTEQFGFQFEPPSDIAQPFERWTVARACGPDGCASRSLDEWLDEAVSLPTFVQALAPESDLEIIEDRFGDDYRFMLTATTADTVIVFVAAFDDGADFYVECGLSLLAGGDARLIDSLIDVCRDTKPVSGQ